MYFVKHIDSSSITTSHQGAVSEYSNSSASIAPSRPRHHTQISRHIDFNSNFNEIQVNWNNFLFVSKINFITNFVFFVEKGLFPKDSLGFRKQHVHFFFFVSTQNCRYIFNFYCTSRDSHDLLGTKTYNKCLSKQIAKLFLL